MGAVLLLLAATFQLVVADPVPALVVPPAFELVDQPTGQAPNAITDYAWLDNGGLLSIGKDGTVAFVPAGGSPRVVTKVANVRSIGDHGMLGLALANDYASTGHLYLGYDKGSTSGAGVGMVEEWTASPPGNPTSLTRVPGRARRQPGADQARADQPEPRGGHGARGARQHPVRHAG